jgi:hypothetical protein
MLLFCLRVKGELSLDFTAVKAIAELDVVSSANTPTPRNVAVVFIETKLYQAQIRDLAGHSSYTG